MAGKMLKEFWRIGGGVGIVFLPVVLISLVIQQPHLLTLSPEYKEFKATLVKYLELILTGMQLYCPNADMQVSVEPGK